MIINIQELGIKNQEIRIKTQGSGLIKRNSYTILTLF
jgi:hypothetical protein